MRGGVQDQLFLRRRQTAEKKNTRVLRLNSRPGERETEKKLENPKATTPCGNACPSRYFDFIFGAKLKRGPLSFFASLPSLRCPSYSDQRCQPCCVHVSACKRNRTRLSSNKVRMGLSVWVTRYLRSVLHGAINETNSQHFVCYFLIVLLHLVCTINCTV